MSVQQLVMMGFAHKIATIDTGTSHDRITDPKVDTFEKVSDSGLWPEDSERLMLNKDFLKKQNIVFKGRVMEGGIKGYKLAISGCERIMSSQTCKLMGFLINKK